jgi:DNA-binding CsgD family transcriptional regulator
MSAHRELLESLLEDGDDRARLALNLDGRIIWASSSAKRILAASFGRDWSLSESLLEKARDVACGLAPSAEFRFAAAGGETTASLNTCRAVTGERFVTIELYSSESRLPAEFRARFRLTAAEAAVLADLSDGLSNAQIARRRNTSITTVRTHVAHILSKMGVRSRLHAGVLARAAM